MSDKLISLESVLKEIRRFKGYIDDDMIERFSIAFKRLPPVELPMNAVEYETALDRMEDSVDGFEVKKLWNEAISLGYIEKAVAIVEKWAREHPEERSE